MYLAFRDFAGKDVKAIERATRVQIALETGWTFEYIDSLRLEDYGDLMGFWAGKAKAEEANQS